MNTPKDTENTLDFTNLVNTYYKPLFRFAYSLAGNQEDAADLTQQSFYIWATPQRLNPGCSLRSIVSF